MKREGATKPVLAAMKRSWKPDHRRVISTRGAKIIARRRELEPDLGNIRDVDLAGPINIIVLACQGVTWLSKCLKLAGCVCGRAHWRHGDRACLALQNAGGGIAIWAAYAGKLKIRRRRAQENGK